MIPLVPGWHRPRLVGFARLLVRFGLTLVGMTMRAGDRVILVEDPIGWGVGTVVEAWNTILVRWVDPVDGTTYLRRHDPFEIELASVWQEKSKITDAALAGLLGN